MKTVDFGEAIKALKQGKKVTRKGWNGKGMFLYYVPANKYPASGNIKETMQGVFENDLAQDNVTPWLASQTDVLSEDWFVLD